MPYTTSQAFIDVMIMYAIVIVVSLLVAVVIRVIVWTLSRRASQAETAAAQTQAAPLPPLDDQVPAAHLAAIAAAVTMMSGTHRIVRIESAPPSYGWAIAGRSAHHHSHITRRS